MAIEREEIFQRLLRDPNNFFCFDCQAESPVYASVSHGIFLCHDCAQFHRTFGVHISFVKGLLDQNWTQKQLQIMAVGGNTPFREYLGRYQFSAGNAERVYRSKAAKAYRDRLKQMAEGTEWLDMDYNPEEGVQEYIEAPPPYAMNEPEPAWKGFFTSAVNRTKQLGTDLAGKATELMAHPSVDDIKEKTKTMIETISSKGKEIVESPAVQSVKTSASDYLEVAKSKASEAYDRVSASTLVQSTKASLLTTFPRLAPQQADPSSNQL